MHCVTIKSVHWCHMEDEKNNLKSHKKKNICVLDDLLSQLIGPKHSARWCTSASSDAKWWDAWLHGICLINMLVHTQEAQPERPLFQCPLTKPAALQLLQLLFHSKQPPSAGLKHRIPGSSHWLARLDAWRWVKTSLAFCPTDVWLSPPSSSSLCLAPTTCSSIFCPTTSTLICASVLSSAWDPSRYVRAQGGKTKT